MKHILWLAGWYPDKFRPFTGDFIERHAVAASSKYRITVLYISKDDQRSGSRKYLVEKIRYNDNCSAIILYYHPYSSIPFIEKAVAGLRYFIFYAELIRNHIHEEGRPDLIHVHVAWRAGILALYCKWRYRLKYVITEHWSGFLSGTKHSFNDLPFSARKMLKRVFTAAWKVSAVSHELGQALRKKFNIPQPLITPNVVDTMLFSPAEKSGELFRFIHASELSDAKNPEMIIEAVRILANKINNKFELVMYAPVEERLIEMARAGGVAHLIRFSGLIPHDQLAREMQAANCLILYSSYETFGCVIIEGNAAGLPVIVSDIPVMHEIVTEEVNGIFAPLNAPQSLAEKMLWMMDHYQQFDTVKIAKTTEEKFGIDAIVSVFKSLYEG
jgi:glycosyltransferase involved in cell wall biosynthesis